MANGLWKERASPIFRRITPSATGKRLWCDTTGDRRGQADIVAIVVATTVGSARIAVVALDGFVELRTGAI